MQSTCSFPCESLELRIDSIRCYCLDYDCQLLPHVLAQWCKTELAIFALMSEYVFRKTLSFYHNQFYLNICNIDWFMVISGFHMARWLWWPFWYRVNPKVNQFYMWFSFVVKLPQCSLWFLKHFVHGTEKNTNTNLMVCAGQSHSTTGFRSFFILFSKTFLISV